VTFTDAAATHSVTLDTTVTPGAVTVNTAASDYSISGAGGIAGSGSFTKTGSGKLTLGLNNTYSGTTNVQQGTLALGTSTALSPNSAVVLGSGANGGALD